MVFDIPTRRIDIELPDDELRRLAAWREPAADGMQQAKEYAGMLGLRFAYATNGLVQASRSAITNSRFAALAKIEIV